MIDIHNERDLERLRAQLRLDPHRIRRLRTAFYKDFREPALALADLPCEARAAFHGHVRFASLTLVERHDSQVDAATKLVLRTAAGSAIETVILRPQTGRTAICVSSQVGCAANCRFCATGMMDNVQSLSRAEIVDQVLLAGRLLREEGRALRNIVFMGMGEPLHNERHLCAALDDLMDPRRFHLPPRRLLVSTVGIPDAMVRLARRYPQINIALSLHSVRQAVRERIVPVAVRFQLSQLRRTLETINALQRHSVMIEYVLFRGLNDTKEDARELIEFLKGLDVHVNLIPFNPVDGVTDLEATDRAEREAFGQVLKRAGLTTTIRYSLGADIAAACGQLVQRGQHRER